LEESLGYPTNDWDGFKKARKIAQEQLWAIKEEDQEREVLSYVSTNDPKSPNFYPVVTQSISMLNANPKIKQTVSNMKIFPRKWKPPNLKKILAKAKFTSQENIGSLPKVKKCNDSM